MSAGVERILSLSKIVCRIVDAQYFVSIEAIVGESDGASFFGCILSLIALVALPKDSGEHMILKLGQEIL